MDFLIQFILPYVFLYKYWAIFIITFLSAFAIPIPAGTLLIASSAFASFGYFNITTLILLAILANIAGDNVSYWITRTYGKRILSNAKFIRKIFASENFNLMGKGIEKHGNLIIFVSRFEVISTLIVNFICGLTGVTYKKFIVFELIGVVISVLFYSSIGYFFGDNWQIIDRIMGNLGIMVAILMILSLSFFWKKIIMTLNKK